MIVSFDIVIFQLFTLFFRLNNEPSLRGKQSIWRQLTGQRNAPEWLDEISTDPGQCIFPDLLSTKLMNLNLDKNRLQQFPNSICELRKLAVLRVSG